MYVGHIKTGFYRNLMRLLIGLSNAVSYRTGIRIMKNNFTHLKYTEIEIFFLKEIAINLIKDLLNV